MSFIYLFIYCCNCSFAQVEDVVKYLKEHPKPPGSYSSLAKANANPNKVTYLNLQGRGLKTLPGDILKYHNLIDLDISDNEIEIIPEWIKKMEKLKKISLRKNKIQFLSPFLFQIPSIEEIDLWGNRINTILITTSSTIQKLNLSFNKIDSIPECLSKFNGLTVLEMESNRVSRLPCFIFRMKSLKYLYLSGNNVNEIESCSLYNPQLKGLYLYHNLITDSQLKKLQILLPNCDVSIQ